MRVICMARRSCLAAGRETRKKRVGVSAYRRAGGNVSARRRIGVWSNRSGALRGVDLSTLKNNVMKSAKHFRELDVYQGATSLVMRIFELTKHFPIEERYTLTDQVRRSSRSVCANLA